MSVQLCYCWFRLGLWHNILMLKIASNSSPRVKALPWSTCTIWWFSDILSYSHVQTDEQTDFWSSSVLIRFVTLSIGLTLILRYTGFKGLLNVNHIQLCSWNLLFKGTNTFRRRPASCMLQDVSLQSDSWLLVCRKVMSDTSQMFSACKENNIHVQRINNESGLCTAWWLFCIYTAVHCTCDS